MTEHHHGNIPSEGTGSGMGGSPATARKAERQRRKELVDLARGINAEYRKHRIDADDARRRAEAAREHLKRLSLMLLDAREKVDEDGSVAWGSWVEENLTFGLRQAQRYVKLGGALRDDATRVSHGSLRKGLASIGAPVERRADAEGFSALPEGVPPPGALPGGSVPTPGTPAGAEAGAGSPLREPSAGFPGGDDRADGGASRRRGARPPRPGGVGHPLLRYRGAKWDLAPDIADLFVEHRVYVEPYLGSAAVFLTKEPSRFEVLNDVDDEIVNLFEVVRTCPEELIGVVGLTPAAETEVRKAGVTLGNALADIDPVERARRFLVISHQARVRLVGPPSYSAATGPTARDNVELWKRVPETVWEVCQRLRDADLRNTKEERRRAGKDKDDEGYGVQKKDAVTLIYENYEPDALVYADPPYVAEKRSKKLYRHDIHGDPTHHHRLVEALADHPGYAYLSGYRNALYEEELETRRGWEAREMDRPGPGKEPEVLWINPKALRALSAEEAAQKEQAARDRQQTSPSVHMGMVYRQPERTSRRRSKIKPEVAVLGSLIGAYLGEGE